VARVREELGIDCSLRDVGWLIYRATCQHSGLVEYEFDHVLIGESEAEPNPDRNEVEAVLWVLPDEILRQPFDGAAPWLVPVIELAERVRSS
jgi:isopentenyl-diphosphate Delta-isomerase